MKTRFLRFPDEAAFLAGLPASFQRQGETGAPLPAGVEAIRILPYPLRRGGRWDDAGVEIEAPEVLAGFHVNAMGELPAEWIAYELPEPPDNPVGIFGDDLPGA